jgi:hypothetical protein
VADDKPDEKRLIAMIGMFGSAHEGERHSALRSLGPVLKRLDLSWVDIGQAVIHREKLLAAAKQLQAERDQALAEIDRLRRTAGANGGTLGQALWVDTATPKNVGNRHAEWALGLAAQGLVNLTPKECDFLTSCSKRRVLTPRMQEWLKDLVTMTAHRTGETPPA